MTSTTIETALHSLLETVGEMNLPEGDYLTLTNMMKKVFDESKKAPQGPVTIVSPPTPIVVKMSKCLMKHIEIEMEVKQIVKILRANGSWSVNAKMEIRTKNTKTGAVVVKQDDGVMYLLRGEKAREFADVLRNLVLRYRPMFVEYTMDEITTEYTLRDLKDNEEEENRVLFDDDDENEMDYTYESMFGFGMVGEVKKAIVRWTNTL